MSTKWYWAYNNDPITWIFKSLDEARDRTEKRGMFDEIYGKDAMMAYDEELFFEVSENEIEVYQPCLLSKAARELCWGIV